MLGLALVLLGCSQAAALCEALAQQQAAARALLENNGASISKQVATTLVNMHVPVNATWTSEIFSNAFLFNERMTWSIFEEDCTTFVTTGDINEMWLRDSAIQTSVYLPWTNNSDALSAVVESILLRQIRFFMTDNYASAFTNGTGPNFEECRRTPSCPQCHCELCSPDCGNYTFQHDFELDAPLFMFLLSWQYYSNAPVKAQQFFTKNAQEYQAAVVALLDLLQVEQHHFSQSKYFYRPLPFPLKDAIGLVWSFARPSDDQTAFYNIPQNAMAVVVLGHLAEISTDVWKASDLTARLKNMSASIDTAIQRYGIIQQSSSSSDSVNSAGTIFAYEVDGYGNFTKEMDDANMPNLLWLPYLGYPTDPALYNRTRAAVLSGANLNYFASADRTYAGLGSQHVTHGCRSVWPGPECSENCVWPLGLIMQALTTDNQTERNGCLQQVVNTAWHGFVHEGFWVSSPDYYNRDYFGWANALFAEWMIKQYSTDVQY